MYIILEGMHEKVSQYAKESHDIIRFTLPLATTMLSSLQYQKTTNKHLLASFPVTIKLKLTYIPHIAI